jgi:hypothetical protein
VTPFEVSDGSVQPARHAVENALVDSSFVAEDEARPEHFLASFYGTFALLLAAAVWSAMAAVFGPWSLAAAPGMGWLIAWSCRYGGRRADTFVRATAWLLGFAGTLLALLVFSAFSVTQTSPDSGFDSRAVALEYLRLFAEPPWFGSAAVLLAMAGVRRALRVGPDRRASHGLELAPVAALGLPASVASPASRAGLARPTALRATPDERGSRAA